MEKASLQEIADQHFSGNRYRAIYHLLDNEGIEDYINEFSKEEAQFVLYVGEKHVIDTYGGEAAFCDAIMADIEAQDLGVTMETIRQKTKNPFAKKALLGIFALIIAIALAILRTTKKSASFDILLPLSSVFIGIASLNFINFFRYKKLQKKAKKLPSIETIKNTKIESPSFEEIYALFLKEKDL